jgi:two-component system, NtrC family, sensor kinase
LRLIQHRLETNAITLNRSFRAAPERLLGDDYELQQAFVNLLLNALDALGENGTLTISTETLPPESAPRGQSGAAPGPWLRVTIQDSGIGIPPEHLRRLFEPFFTTKATGTGLGLPITRRIVQRHHGEITAQSQPGKGTTFEILLPALVK